MAAIFRRRKFDFFNVSSIRIFQALGEEKSGPQSFGLISTKFHPIQNTLGPIFRPNCFGHYASRTSKQQEEEFGATNQKSQLPNSFGAKYDNRRGDSSCLGLMVHRHYASKATPKQPEEHSEEISAKRRELLKRASRRKREALKRRSNARYEKLEKAVRDTLSSIAREAHQQTKEKAVEKHVQLCELNCELADLACASTLSRQRRKVLRLMSKEIDAMLRQLEDKIDDLDEKINAIYLKDTSGTYLPIRKDWSKEVNVTPIKLQKTDDCWAHAVIEALEFLLTIKTGRLCILSVQELLDCNKSNKGFEIRRQGSTLLAYEYILRRGISYEKMYPYTGLVGCACKRSKLNGPVVRIHSFKEVQLSEAELVKILAIQPITVVICNCDERIFDYNGKEIFDGVLSADTPQEERFNHCGVLVGRDVDKKGQKYWKIKFAWGRKFGANGYLYLAIRSWASTKGAYQFSRAICPTMG